MSKLSFRARALDASKPMPIYIAEELPDLPDYSAINRAVPQMPSGMEKEEECEHHLQRAICTGLIIPTPEVCEVNDLEFYERCYPPDYKMPKQHIHMQPLWQEHETPEYDIDSEDERWLKQQRHPELTELKFEQMMDKLEKSSGQTVVTLNEAKLLLERHDDLVIAVYDYWLNKRLKTQHPLVLSVKTENRPGQSSNNPYLAFRRRTEKMQTRKNRKNDESSYEKMLKLRRDLAHALSVLEMVARREQLKRDFVLLTALVAEKRYSLGDFANHLLPDIPPRLQYSNVPLSTPPSFRREQYTVQNFPPRAPPVPVDQPRQREKRPYKRRKHRHHTAGSQALRDSGVCTSSEEEGSSRAEALSSPDDGLYTFRRKTGCYYEMPTSTLCGDPVDPDDPSKEGLYKHEIDERHRYTLTSLRLPYSRCVGFARRRMTRGGRVALDRRSTPLDDLWPRLDFTFPGSQEHRADRAEEVELETKPHRTPKVLSRDYHSGGKHPWRHAFRQHLSTNFPLWTDESNCTDAAQTVDLDIPHDSVKSDISVNTRTVDSVSDNLQRVIRKRSWSGCSDSSYDSDSSLVPVEKEFSHMMDEINNEWLHFRPKTPPISPARSESPHADQFPLAADTKFTVELRPAEKPPTADLDTFTTAEFSLADIYPDIPDIDNTGSSLDISGDDLLNENFTGLTEAQVESILSETDLKALADVDLGREEKKPSPEELLDELSESFLSHGQGLEGRAGSGGRRGRDSFGSTRVLVVAKDREPVYVDVLPPDGLKLKKEVIKEKKPLPQPVPTLKIVVDEAKDAVSVKVERKRSRDVAETPPALHNAQSTVHSAQSSVHSAHSIVHSAQSSVHAAQTTIHATQSSVHGAQSSVHGAQSSVQSVQIKTVHAKQSALKKHIITSSARRITDLKDAQPQIVTVSVPADTLKMRLQNHLASSQASVVASSSSTSAASAATSAGTGSVVGLVQNGPFATAAGVAVALPIHHHSREQATGVTSVTTSGAVVAGATVATGAPRRATPLIQLAPALARQQLHLSPPVVVSPHQLHAHHPNKLKVLHGTPLTPTQRTQLLQGRAGISHLPTVVSLATLEAKTPNNAALLKTSSGSVTQFFEIKSGQLGKGPHLVNVVRQPQPGKTTVARLDLNDAKKRQVVFDGTALKGNITAARPHRVSLNLDGRQIVRTAIPSVRAQQVRHQLQFKNRTLQVAAPISRTSSEASTSITIAAPTKTTSLPSSVVNLLQKNVQLPKKIAISAPGGSPMAANLQAIAFTQAQLKARQARLITQPRAQPVAEIVEATTAPVPASSTSAITDTPIEVTDEESTTNGTVRRRTADTLPMEVT